MGTPSTEGVRDGKGDLEIYNIPARDEVGTGGLQGVVAGR